MCVVLRQAVRRTVRVCVRSPLGSMCILDVGNKAAVFPLQLLGFDVDIVNSVQFSNHTGYPSGWEGDVLDGAMLGRLVEGMERNGLLADESGAGRIGNILTGYIGSESFLRSVVHIVQKLKLLNPTCRYVCDPVLGDLGRFYVPKELVDIYRSDVLPLADVVTPNQFEIEQLTGISIRTLEDAKRACCLLHDWGVSTVLITSIVFEESGHQSADLTADRQHAEPTVGMFASRRMHNSQQTENEQETTDEQYVLYSPKFDGQFTGTGDVCAALFLAWTVLDGDGSLASSLEKLAGTMHAIVRRTYNAATKKRTQFGVEQSQLVSSREMQLIQSRDDILNPPRNLRASKVAPGLGRPYQTSRGLHTMGMI
ncbi:hypothetical protein ACHAXT_009751 [Thalassiosira profunda]